MKSLLLANYLVIGHWTGTGEKVPLQASRLNCISEVNKVHSSKVKQLLSQRSVDKMFGTDG